MDLWLIGVGGGLGALSRFLLDRFIRSRVATRIPAGTVAINVSGSLLLGALSGLVLFHGASATLMTVMGTGFCGGYTTFSAASFETVRLVQERCLGAALANTLITLIGSLGAGAIGLALASM
ncbi:MAG: fluoride efflux transporter CrcB [Acidimicrobiales bacterium]